MKRRWTNAERGAFAVVALVCAISTAAMLLHLLAKEAN